MLLMDCKRRGYAGRGFDMGWRDEGSTDHGYREDLFINVITLIELFFVSTDRAYHEGEILFNLFNLVDK